MKSWTPKDTVLLICVIFGIFGTYFFGVKSARLQAEQKAVYELAMSLKQTGIYNSMPAVLRTNLDDIVAISSGVAAK